jgi:hypothetical protein
MTKRKRRKGQITIYETYIVAAIMEATEPRVPLG